MEVEACGGKKAIATGTPSGAGRAACLSDANVPGGTADGTDDGTTGAWLRGRSCYRRQSMHVQN